MIPLDEKQRRLVRNALADRPDAAAAFEDFLARADGLDFDSLLGEVDESDYSLEDWVDALLAFDAWMEQREAKTRPLDSMTGYVSCCAEMNAPQIGLAPLKVIVNQSLAEHGFEAAHDLQD